MDWMGVGSWKGAGMERALGAVAVVGVAMGTGPVGAGVGRVPSKGAANLRVRVRGVQEVPLWQNEQLA